jgi:hypothetical protein
MFYRLQPLLTQHTTNLRLSLTTWPETGNKAMSQHTLLPCVLFLIFIPEMETGWLPLWSCGQTSWLADLEVPGSIPGTASFPSSSGSGMESIQPREDKWEATWKKSSGSPVLKTEINGHGGSAALTTWHRSICKSWHQITPTIGRCSVGIVCLWNKGHGVCFWNGNWCSTGSGYAILIPNFLRVRCLYHTFVSYRSDQHWRAGHHLQDPTLCPHIGSSQVEFWWPAWKNVGVLEVGSHVRILVGVS